MIFLSFLLFRLNAVFKWAESAFPSIIRPHTKQELFCKILLLGKRIYWTLLKCIISFAAIIIQIWCIIIHLIQNDKYLKYLKKFNIPESLILQQFTEIFLPNFAYPGQLRERPIHFLNTFNQQVSITPWLSVLLKNHIHTMLPKNFP